MSDRKTEVTATGNGASEAIDRSSFLGMYALYVVAGTWGGATSAQLQLSPDGESWVDEGTAATANAVFKVPGNAKYRINVTDYSGSLGLKLVCREYEKGC